MKTLKNILILILLTLATSSFAQKSITKIDSKTGVHYIIPSLEYPILGTYLFKGSEPLVALNAGGTGIYQLHDQPKRPMVWGIECNEAGEPKCTKGFDNAAYTLWYSFTDGTQNGEQAWYAVELSVHFNSNKIFIQGERMKTFSGEEKK